MIAKELSALPLVSPPQRVNIRPRQTPYGTIRHTTIQPDIYAGRSGFWGSGAAFYHLSLACGATRRSLLSAGAGGRTDQLALFGAYSARARTDSRYGRLHLSLD